MVGSYETFFEGNGKLFSPTNTKPKLIKATQKVYLVHFTLKFLVFFVAEAELNLILCIIILRYEQEAEKDRARYNTEKKEYLNKQSVC
jgi:hypothetical protein